ncbi:MAG: hypothetical protein ACYCPM_02465 [Acidobacteriaceae bacterium]
MQWSVISMVGEVLRQGSKQIEYPQKCPVQSGASTGRHWTQKDENPSNHWGFIGLTGFPWMSANEGLAEREGFEPSIELLAL